MLKEMAMTRKALVKVLLIAGMMVLRLTSANEQQGQLLQRNKRTLTTICVEIQPSGPQAEPYFMCRGMGNRGQQDVRPASNNQVAGNYGDTFAGQNVEFKSNYQQQQKQQQYQKHQEHPHHQTPVTFPSFPTFGAGFFQASSKPIHENLYSNTAGQASQSSQPMYSSYGNGFSTSASAPSSAAQSYGLPAVSYSNAGGPAATEHGTSAGAGSASPSAVYADTANKKQTSTAQQSKSQPNGSQAVEGYDSLLSSRQLISPDGVVRAMPKAGFEMQQINRATVPFVATDQTHLQPIDHSMAMLMAPNVPMAQSRFQQPTTMTISIPGLGTPDFYDDPVMRAFYNSFPQPQQTSARIQHQGVDLSTMSLAQPQTETVLGQAPAAAYSNDYSQSAVPPAASALTQSTQPAVQLKQTAYPMSSQPVTQIQRYNSQPMQVPITIASSAFSECKPLCQTPTSMSSQCCDNGISYAPPCQSYQPVIIAMPCYGHQQQFLATASDRHTQGNSPIVGSTNGMAPTLGAPFGVPPILNPFGPLGNLNPFNPFNRLLGATSPAATSASQQVAGNPFQRLFHMGGQILPSTEMSTIIPRVTTNTEKLSLLESVTSVPPSNTTNIAPDLLGNPRDADSDSNEDDDDNNDDNGDGDGDDKNDEQQRLAESVSDSPETVTTKGEIPIANEGSIEKYSAKQLVDKAEEKINLVSKQAVVIREKQKRRNAPSSNGNGNSQKRKYLQRL